MPNGLKRARIPVNSDQQTSEQSASFSRYLQSQADPLNHSFEKNLSYVFLKREKIAGMRLSP
tara:strand:- start:177 stop:362 length:186 start_codon:yes stop_codon:yes gene_type:complete